MIKIDQDSNILKVKEKTELNLFNDLKQFNLFDYSKTNFETRTPAYSLKDIGISSQKIKQFNNANIYHTGDLLNYLPNKYIDYSNPKSVKEIEDGEICSMIGKIKEVKKVNNIIYAKCIDGNGSLFTACWFNQPYVLNKLEIGYKYIFCGKIQLGYGTQIIPTQFSRNISELKTIIPVYKKIKGMSNEFLINSIKTALSLLKNNDHLEKSIVYNFGLISKYDFYNKIHCPNSFEDINKAMERYIFDKLFRFNLIMKKDSISYSNKSNFIIKNTSIFEKILLKLPYQLTIDQKDTVNNMIKIMKSGQKLSALVQGDVGSGKTIIAFILMCLAKENNFQSALIAPTEVLAKQHFNDFRNLVSDLGISCALLTGSTKTKERKLILEKLKNGEIDVLIGTHALIQDSVEYKELGLVIIDEQHRFGVEQRNKLSKSSNKPHVVIMSATPIPRTLSMAIYGDSISVFNIKTKPSGRKDIITKKVNKSEDAYDFIYKEIKHGKQAYIICPLINISSSEKMADVQSVEEAVKEANKYFSKYPEIKISSINGKMKQSEIEEKIKEFYEGKTHILISTTIVEVGVNVPNASVMFIKNSERFGLAQAHQLRGRVGRSSYQSYCLLLAKDGDPKADILCNSSDGFVIAKEDLKMRGSGDFLGTKQSGLNEDVEFMLSFPELYRKIAEENDKIFNDKKRLEKYSFFFN